jgi:hypothetical protein
MLPDAPSGTGVVLVATTEAPTFAAGEHDAGAGIGTASRAADVPCPGREASRARTAFRSQRGCPWRCREERRGHALSVRRVLIMGCRSAPARQPEGTAARPAEPCPVRLRARSVARRRSDGETAWHDGRCVGVHSPAATDNSGGTWPTTGWSRGRSWWTRRVHVRHRIQR